MLITILTLFPDALEPYLSAGILGRARERGLVEVTTVDFRDFTRDRHRTVDDRPFGGGPGMVLKPEPIVECVEWLERRHGLFHKVLLSPQGTPFAQRDAHRLLECDRLLLCCGRYEGFDERVRQVLDWEEISMGDFVLAGGEIPALAVTEAVARLVPGALGHDLSAVEESFQGEGGLDHPHFTRPRTYRGHTVPEVLLDGDHAQIAKWRSEAARRRTRERRPDIAH